MKARSTLAYLIEPRFPGGTSAAVARELRALCDLVHIEVYAVSSRMFKKREVAPVLQRALDDLGISVVWDPVQVSADTVVVHNPAFLKLERALSTRILTQHLIVVTHENFLRPAGLEPFHVSHCLGLLETASLALRKSLVPVSPYNRSTVQNWLERSRQFGNWTLLGSDWHNICDFQLLSPTQMPSDRRGRHSRPGFEKFPSLALMDECFPPHADANVIVGADTFLHEAVQRPHWTMVPFQGIEIDDYFEMIDFMVYFTAPTWRESFGRVLAEGVSAGKIVIADPETASVFAGAVVPASPSEVDAVIGHFLANPRRYVEHVRKAQTKLEAFSAHSFRAAVDDLIGLGAKVAA